MKHQPQPGNWESVCNRLLAQLHDHHYADSTLTNYRRALNRIGAFLESNNGVDYSEGIGSRYFNEWAATTKPTPGSVRFIKVVVHRLNDTLAKTGYLSRHTPAPQTCPDCFAEQAGHYFEYLRLRGIRESTISLNRRYCFEFLRFLVDTGISRLEDMEPKHIYAAFAETKSAANFHTAVTPFLKFTYSHKHNTADLSLFVPKPRRPQPLPSVYSSEEVQRVFTAIDTSSTIGKRDYAILSLAAMLGLRRSDICSLTLGNIGFNTKKISLVQQKTGVPLETDLLPEVEDALLSYIEAVKPANNTALIFLSERAPYRPLLAKSVYNIAQKHFRAAGISIEGKKHGTHSLRMSLATQLISEDVPYGAIQRILGQDDPNSTKHYARIDVEKLRAYALDVPPPSGLFAKRLGISERGVQ